MSDEGDYWTGWTMNSDDEFLINNSDIWNFDDVTVQENDYDTSGHMIVHQILAIAILVLSVLGNSFLCYLVIRHHRWRNEQVLFFSLAAADLLKANTNILMHLITLNHGWNAGLVFCKFVVIVQVLSEVCSFYTIVSVVLSQFVLLFKPEKTGFYRMWLVSLPWIIGLVPALSHLYFAELMHVNSEQYYCIRILLSPENTLYYLIVFLIGETYCPIVICVVLFAVIFWKKKPLGSFLKHPGQMRTFYLGLSITVYFVVSGLIYSFEHVSFILTEITQTTVSIHGYFYFLALSSCAVNPLFYVCYHFGLCYFKRQGTSVTEGTEIPADGAVEI